MSKKENLQVALRKIQQKKQLRCVGTVAKKYGVPPSTLHHHVQVESRLTNCVDTCRREGLLMPGITGDGLWDE